MLRLCYAAVISPTKNPRCRWQARERVGRRRLSRHADLRRGERCEAPRHPIPRRQGCLGHAGYVPTFGRTLGRPIFAAAPLRHRRRVGSPDEACCSPCGRAADLSSGLHRSARLTGAGSADGVLPQPDRYRDTLGAANPNPTCIAISHSPAAAGALRRPPGAARHRTPGSRHRAARGDLAQLCRGGRLGGTSLRGSGVPGAPHHRHGAGGELLGYAGPARHHGQRHRRATRVRPAVPARGDRRAPRHRAGGPRRGGQRFRGGGAARAGPPRGRPAAVGAGPVHRLRG